MRTILMEFPGLGNNRIFDPNARDHATEGWIYLQAHLRELGYDLKTADDLPLEGVHSIWFWEMPLDIRSLKSRLQYKFRHFLGINWQRNLYHKAQRQGLDMVLFLFEPPTTRPDNWRVENHRLFSTIFTWHDAYIDKPGYHKLFYPQPVSFPPVEQVEFSDKKLLVNISSNRSSAHPNELYTMRRATIRHFETNHPDEFDLFGIGWDRNKDEIYPSYQGMIDHKWNVYPRYRFAICYENIKDEPGYVTEKIFDPMRVGCVPIYWGAGNIGDYVDPAAFIDRRQFETDVELARYLRGMGENEHRHYQEAGKAYLHGSQFAQFLPQNFAETITRTLDLAEGVDQNNDQEIQHLAK